jgi:hypothetical protein
MEGSVVLGPCLEVRQQVLSSGLILVFAALLRHDFISNKSEGSLTRALIAIILIY